MGTKIGKNRIEDLRNYKVYTALLSQAGTAVPTAIVLENTLGGSINYSYNTAGQFSATSTGLFTNAKTGVIISSVGSMKSGYNYIDTSTINFFTSISGTYTNDGLSNTLIEIRVYN